MPKLVVLMRLICLLTATLLALPALAQDNTPINEVVLDRQAHPTLVGPRALQPDCPVSWCAPALGLTLEIQDSQGASLVPVMRRPLGKIALVAARRISFPA